MTVSAFTALLLLQGAAPAAQPPVESEIVVLAERLRTVRISPGVKIRKGVVTTGTCKVKRSSGDAEIDALACDAVELCATRPAPSRKDFNTCVKTEALASIERLVAERRAQAANDRAAS